MSSLKTIYPNFTIAKLTKKKDDWQKDLSNFNDKLLPQLQMSLFYFTKHNKVDVVVHIICAHNDNVTRLMFTTVSHFLVRREEANLEQSNIHLISFLNLETSLSSASHCLGLLNFSCSSKQIMQSFLSHKITGLQLNPHLSTPPTLTPIYHCPLQLIPSPPQGVFTCFAYCMSCFKGSRSPPVLLYS